MKKQPTYEESEEKFKRRIEKVLDQQFTKGKCKERGGALLLFAESMHELTQHTLSLIDSLIDSTIERIEGEIERLKERLKDFDNDPLHPVRTNYVGQRDAKQQELTHWKELKDKMTKEK